VINSSQLSALFHLASPALPIGGFSYSQGLEAAVFHGLVNDATTAQSWIKEHLKNVVFKVEAVIWLYQFEAWNQNNLEMVSRWNEWFWASRETNEFRKETEQMGWSLLKLIQEVGLGKDEDFAVMQSLKPITLPCVHAYLCNYQKIEAIDGLHAYLFSWLENQIMAAIKIIPLGQIAGQKILIEVRKTISSLLPELIEDMQSPHFPLNTFSPQLSILSSRHEMQYSRLFRS
jgi:urease accessory protein